MRLSISDLVRYIPALEPALRPLVAGGKVVTRGRELLQRLGGAVSNLQGEIVSEKWGGERVSVKHAAATQRAARAKSVASAAEEEVARLRGANVESSRAFDDGGEVRRE